MRSSAHPSRFIHAALGIALLTLTPGECAPPNAPANKRPKAPPATATAPAAESTPSASIPVISDGLSPSFRAVASRLELGGRSFEYSEVSGAKAIAAFLDEILKSLPAEERKDIPPGFTIAKIFNMLGLDSVAATGSSSRARADGTYHSRNFAYMPAGRKGLAALTGGTPAKLLMLDVAPKDTDFALEFPIDLKDFSRDVLAGALEMVPAAERPKIEQQMAQPIPGIGLSGKQIVEKLDVRIGVFLRLDPTQKIKLEPDAPVFPGADGLVVIDGAGWLFEALKPQFMKDIESPDSPFTVSLAAGVLTIQLAKPTGPAPMDFQPVMRFDPKADRILIASRPALMASTVAGTGKITQGAGFTDTWRDLPAEGNACFYASPRLLQTFTDLVATAAQTAGKGSAADTALVGKIFEWIKPLTSHGQAAVMTNQPDGILTVSNTSIPTGSSLGTVSAVAMLAGFALPVFSKAQEKARESDDLSTVKQLAVALKIYAAEHGKYPPALSELVKAKILTDDKMIEFTDRTTHQRQPWIYRNTLTDTSPANELLLAAPAPSRSGKRAVAFADGSAKMVTEEEFQELSAKK